MNLHGGTYIGRDASSEGEVVFRATNPATGETLEPDFVESTIEEVDRAVCRAEVAFEAYAALPASRRATFLRAAADALLELGDALLERANLETALPHARLEGERARTAGQFRTFADVVDEGSWVEARLDGPLPDRKPLPRPDLRRMLVPLGPVAVFGASNFPLAFSVAGGDTASALAAGCPVVVKAHPAHPGTSELAAWALLEAAARTGMPDGVVSLVHGVSHAVGAALVRHPLIRAAAFTGSLAGGRALFDAASRRDEPIPVYAEMGSSNPVFVLPGALAERGDAIARGLAASVTLGAGQFCTNPGLTILDTSDAADRFLASVGAAIAAVPAGTVATTSIKEAYDRDFGIRTAHDCVQVAARSTTAGAWAATSVSPSLLVADAAAFRSSPELAHEHYGPVTLAVRCSEREELLAVARSLTGHLTATVHATADDLEVFAELLPILRRKVGRLVVNGFPTGVEVCPSMHHGGPYPATTDARATSVGTAAIVRFARPLCFQDVPEAALPEELRDANPRQIWRLVDGEMVKGPR